MRGLDAWQQGAKPNLRTSIVIDPKDGRLPPMTPEAARRREAARAAAMKARPAPGEGYFWNGVWAQYPDSHRGLTNVLSAARAREKAGAAGSTRRSQQTVPAAQ